MMIYVAHFRRGSTNRPRTVTPVNSCGSVNADAGRNPVALERQSWFALRSLTHYALKTNGRSTSERHFLLDAGFRARTPTLMHGGWLRRMVLDCSHVSPFGLSHHVSHPPATGTPSLVRERHARRALS
jgi:hypothetical protein